jgi:hypothetical protein
MLAPSSCRMTQRCPPSFHLARFVLTPVSQTLNIYRRQDIDLLAAATGGLALVGSFLAGWWLDLGYWSTILLYSLGSTAAVLLALALVWRVARGEVALAAGRASTARPDCPTPTRARPVLRRRRGRRRWG